MRTCTLCFCLIMTIGATLHGQNFLDGASFFSKDKEAFITLQNGDELVGYVDKIKRKKGLIESIALKGMDGAIYVMRAEQVSHMYLAPHGLDKLATSNRRAINIAKWDDDHSAHAQHIKKGYVFFETAEVMLKKKKATMLLQLINPGFANRIKVYADPRATETGGMSVGGMQVSGGDKKSYYISKDGTIAERLSKGSYAKTFDRLYGDCTAFSTAFEKNRSWSNVERHVFYYAEHCE
jgi:hypothetical protein